MAVEEMMSLLAPFVRSLPRFTALAEAVLRQAAGLQAVIPELESAFSLDAAMGCQLDQIGEMFGLSRDMMKTGSGASDAAFRSFLKAKLALWRWNGRSETAGAAIREAFPENTVRMKDNGNGSVTVIGAETLPAQAESVLPVPAGIRISS